MKMTGGLDLKVMAPSSTSKTKKVKKGLFGK